jgi:hypothetical protein
MSIWDLDLKYKKYGIIITGKKEIRDRNKATLDWIAGGKSGKALLDAMGSTGQTLVIRPFDKGGKACTAANRNAYASADDWEDATSKGQWLYKTDDPKTARDESLNPVSDFSVVRSLLSLPQEPMLGTGEGSDVTVEFTADMWGFGNQCSAPGGQPGSSPSQVLFHELVHGYRMMRGHFFNFPMTRSQKPYDNEEEFFAIVVSNVFIADTSNPFGSRTLRSDHHGFGTLAAAQSTNKGFLAHKNNRERLERFAKAEAKLVAALKSVKGVFNPFSSL